MNNFLSVVDNWFVSNQLKISPKKSAVTLFTTWTKEVKTHLDQHIQTVTRPKILGVTVDNMLTFCEHGKSVQNKMQSKTKILKTPTRSSWGKDKETLTISCKAIGRSIANYLHSNLAHQTEIGSTPYRTTYLVTLGNMLPENTKKTENFISRGGLNPANLKLGTKSIHKADVRSAKNNYITNFITTNRTGTT